MKRFLSFTLFGLGTVLAGCPIYPDSGTSRRVCDSQGCYDCPDDYASSNCSSWQCSSDYDCPGGFSCDGTHSCVPSGSGTGTEGSPCKRPGDCATGYTCGTDETCHIGDCTNTGCIPGYVCKLSGGTVQCVPTGTPVDAGVPPTDAGPVGCHNDSECSAIPGARCLSGECVAPAGQCTDSTQCPGTERCVQGACTPACDATTACPTGYSCDLSKGVCTGNPTPCGADGKGCTGGTVCSQDHCVAPCGDGGTCATGSVCIQGGCVPDGKPRFTCATEGAQSECATGSICLHHSCYIACNPDAGADACKSADKFNVCKSVQTSSKTYSVCGSSTNLGTECDPTRGKTCPTAGSICIDGFCR